MPDSGLDAYPIAITGFTIGLLFISAGVGYVVYMLLGERQAEVAIHRRVREMALGTALTLLGYLIIGVSGLVIEGSPFYVSDPNIRFILTCSFGAAVTLIAWLLSTYVRRSRHMARAAGEDKDIWRALERMRATSVSEASELNT